MYYYERFFFSIISKLLSLLFFMILNMWIYNLYLIYFIYIFIYLSISDRGIVSTQTKSTPTTQSHYIWISYLYSIAHLRYVPSLKWIILFITFSYLCGCALEQLFVSSISLLMRNNTNCHSTISLYNSHHKINLLWLKPM